MNNREHFVHTIDKKTFHVHMPRSQLPDSHMWTSHCELAKIGLFGCQCILVRKFVWIWLALQPPYDHICHQSTARAKWDQPPRSGAAVAQNQPWKPWWWHLILIGQILWWQGWQGFACLFLENFLQLTNLDIKYLIFKQNTQNINKIKIRLFSKYNFYCIRVKVWKKTFWITYCLYLEN